MKVESFLEAACGLFFVALVLGVISFVIYQRWGTRMKPPQRSSGGSDVSSSQSPTGPWAWFVGNSSGESGGSGDGDGGGGGGD